MTSGLSLALAWGIVHNQGGFIEANGDHGSETTYNVYLPNEIESTDPLLYPTETPGHSPTILVVDDDEMALAVIAEMLHLLGYQVLTAGEGEKAIKIYQKKFGRIDLVLLDIMMPEMTGDVVFQELKRLNPNVKAICASGYCAPETVQKMLSEGCHGYFPKPMNLAELSHHVNRVLSK